MPLSGDETLRTCTQRSRVRRVAMFAIFISGWVSSPSNVQTSAPAFARETIPRASARQAEVQKPLPRASARQAEKPVAAPPAIGSPRAFLDKYCVTCHNDRVRTAGLSLESLDVTNPTDAVDTWERVIAKLRAGSMPPPGRPRPDSTAYHAVTGWLESEIDRAWAANPNPGRTDRKSVV